MALPGYFFNPFCYFTVIEKYLITWEINMNNGNINSYRIAKDIGLLVKMFLIIAFSYITINFSGGNTLPNTFTLILVGSIFAVVSVGLILYMHINKKASL